MNDWPEMELPDGWVVNVAWTTVYWVCGHSTTTEGPGMPRHCPVCTGQSDALLLETSAATPFVVADHFVKDR